MPHAGCDVEEQPFVDHVGVVVDVSAVLAEYRVPAGGKWRNDIMPGEFAARVHEVEAGLRFVICGAIEDAEALGCVCRVEVDDVLAYGRVKTGESEREPPCALLGGV